MYKNLIIFTAALAILSVGSLVSAQAGGSTSAASKYRHSTQSASVDQDRGHYKITEFSSSSAPKR
jgi:hypothetical protein